MRRNLAEDSSNEEFEIAVNGPNLANSDGVIKEAIERWKLALFQDNTSGENGSTNCHEKTHQYKKQPAFYGLKM